MSMVTNVMVLTSYTPGECVPLLAAGFRDSGNRLISFADIAAYPGPADNWAGSKVPECEVWAGAFNYCNVDEVVAWLKALPWSNPVTAVVLREQADAWEIIPVTTPPES